jgi:hypothetical protein
MVQGTITLARAVAQQSGRHREWVAEFVYVYVVEGEYYAGYYFRSAYIHDEGAAWRVAEGWDGRTLMVRYNPKRHDVAKVLPRDQIEGRIGNLP